MTSFRGWCLTVAASLALLGCGGGGSANAPAVPVLPDPTPAPGENDPKPTKVLLLGDSLMMRTHRALNSLPAVASGTDVTVRLAQHNAIVGAMVRCINQADPALNIDVPVVAITENDFTVHFPFDVSKSFSGTFSGALYFQRNDTGWFNYAQGSLAQDGRYLELVRNAGDGGDTTAQVLARIPTEVANYPADIVVEMSGINDIGRYSTQQIIENKGRIYDALLALGLHVYAGTIWPFNKGFSGDTAVGLQQLRDVNDYIRNRCRTTQGMSCWDGYARLAGADGRSAEGLIESAGVHPLPAGAVAAAEQFVADAAADLRIASRRRVNNSADGYLGSGSWNLVVNPQFLLGPGSTVPANTPQGWTVTGGGTNSLAPTTRADGKGNDLKISRSNTAPNQLTLQQDLTGRVLPGQLVRFGIEMESNAVASGQYLSASLEFMVDGVPQRLTVQKNEFTYANGGRVPPPGKRYFFESDVAKIPAATTAIHFKVIAMIGDAGEMAVTVARPQVEIVMP